MEKRIFFLDYIRVIAENIEAASPCKVTLNSRHTENAIRKKTAMSINISEN